MIRDMFRDYTMRWWQVSLLKVSLAAFGLAVGATWPGAFEPEAPVAASRLK